MSLKPHSAPSGARRRLLAGSSAGLLVSLLGCGGGEGGIAGIGTGGTGSFSSGAIRGFASILVHDVHYDEAGARVVDDAGRLLDSASLRLGMVVDINGSTIRTDANGRRRAQASAIQVRSQLSGPVAGIDRGAGLIVVLDQPVRITPTTVFGDELRGGLATLATGRIVEVHGLLQPEGGIVATRIDTAGEQPAWYKLHGLISRLDRPAQQLRIGAAVVSYAWSVPLPADLEEGRYARIELSPRIDPSGIWQARNIRVADTAIDLPSTGPVEAEIEGYVTSIIDDRQFRLGGLVVDTSAVTPPVGALRAGLRVEVEGMLSAAFLRARSVDIEDDDESEEIGISGTITSVSPGAHSFVVRGLTVDYRTARFEDGSAAQLAPGIEVEVQGRLGSDGATLIATRVELED